MTSTPNNNSVVDNYIKRVTELSQSGQRLPTAEELEKIASELGVSNGDIQIAQQECLASFVRGKSYLGLKHWDEAIQEFQEAIILNPTNLDMLHHLALAYLGRWKDKPNRNDEEQVRLRIKQCLKIQPDHPESLTLLANFNKDIKKRKNIKLGLSVGLIALLSGGAGFIFFNDYLYNTSKERQAKLDDMEGRLSQQIEALKQQQQELKAEIERLNNNNEMTTMKGQLYQMQIQINELENKIKVLENPIFSPFTNNN